MKERKKERKNMARRKNERKKGKALKRDCLYTCQKENRKKKK